VPQYYSAPNPAAVLLRPLHAKADGSYSLANCWCAGNSQEFDQVSPAMWEEFCLQYQKPIFGVSLLPDEKNQTLYR